MAGLSAKVKHQHGLQRTTLVLNLMGRLGMRAVGAGAVDATGQSRRNETWGVTYVEVVMRRLCIHIAGHFV